MSNDRVTWLLREALLEVGGAPEGEGVGETRLRSDTKCCIRAALTYWRDLLSAGPEELRARWNRE